MHVADYQNNQARMQVIIKEPMAAIAFCFWVGSCSRAGLRQGFAL